MGDGLSRVESPIVGTFYQAPSPESPPFVEVGDHVSEGQTLGIIEAMKIFNEIVADQAGTVREVCVQNAEAVEYGTLLFLDRAVKLLVANRGEIAVRIIRSARELDIPTVAIYSTADADSLAVELADEAVCVGPPPANESYLVIRNVIGAAEVTGCDAVHPGYGFLAENPEFARACAENDITFVGPSPDVMSRMSDKVDAKAAAKEAGSAGAPRLRRTGRPGA